MKGLSGDQYNRTGILSVPNQDINGFYDVLGLDPLASADDVEAAYIRLMKIYPLRSEAGPLLADRIDKIKEAHSVLSNNFSRAEYDRQSRGDNAASKIGFQRSTPPASPPLASRQQPASSAPSGGVGPWGERAGAAGNPSPGSTPKSPTGETTALPPTPPTPPNGGRTGPWGAGPTPEAELSFRPILPPHSQEGGAKPSQIPIEASARLTPVSCMTCGIQSHRLRVFGFGEVKSFLVFTWHGQKTGIYCQECAEKAAFKSTLITVLFGWWGFPWGFIYPPAALITNLFGGKRPPDENTALLLTQARAYASRGEYPIAQSCLSSAALFALEARVPYRAQAQAEISDLQSLLPPGGGIDATKDLGGWGRAFGIQCGIIALVIGVLWFALSHLGQGSKQATPAATAPAAAGSAYAVASPALNCRADRDPKANVVEQLSKDTQITSTDEAGGWIKTHRDAGDCWVNEAFLTKLQSGPAPAQQGAAPPATEPPQAAPAADESRVALVSEGGTFKVPVRINDTIQLGFTVDSRAADVTIPVDVFSTLVRAGTINDSDMLGEQTYTTADGSNHTAQTFVIRSLKVGDWEVKNVQGSVGEPQAPMLLGQTFLKRFHSWSIDNATHELVLK